ncbi:coenzyme A pyrophosphatase [Streptococcus sp. X16XC17]|uniref:NUDIX hydrolase n=1 Tax=unclassified Streptococcus TaxID=2608887 RepID=UPI00069D4C89|nr:MULTISPECIES: NUDIX domain-containing protein [unclassified Streptococcus]TCD45579.1 coenzyme A pyrophosphatase [Streptococcus sp. X16XC17]
MRNVEVVAISGNQYHQIKFFSRCLGRHDRRSGNPTAIGREEFATLRQAAIRETVEELQISEDTIEILGEIDYIVHPDRIIHCLVGKLHIQDWTTIVPNEEVERLFTVPLSQLLENGPTYYCLDTVIEKDSNFPFERIQNGVDYKFSHYQRNIPFYECLPENIWGMTAQFTHRFTESLKEGN